MQKALVFVAALGLPVALPASAARPDSQKAKIVRLTKENKALRHRVHDLTLARDSARMALAAEREKNAALTAQVVDLQAARPGYGLQDTVTDPLYLCSRWITPGTPGSRM